MTHLSPEQISQWILGERQPDAEEHFGICRKCRDDIARLQESLSVFKRGMLEWASASDVTSSVAVPARRLSRTSWGWVAAAAMVMTVALTPRYLETRRAQHEAELAQDSLLLNEVQAHLDRTVPQSMEQLMDLMREEPGGPQ